MEPATDTKRADDASETLLAMSELAQAPSVERALRSVRDFLGMDVAYATEHVGDKQIFRFIEGDTTSFGLSAPIELPLDQTYCQRILDGRLPNLNPDIRGDERSASLPITKAADVGAFASVPLRFSDGRLFGTLCAASHATHEAFAYRDLEFLHVFARLVADQLEQQQLRAISRDLELRSTASGAILAAVEARDSYTGRHSQAVVEYAVAVARELELSEGEVADVRQVALLHDVGKLAIPDNIRNKPGPLSSEEWEVMRTHPIESERITRPRPDLARLGGRGRANRRIGPADRKARHGSRLLLHAQRIHAREVRRDGGAARSRRRRGARGQALPRRPGERRSRAGVRRLGVPGVVRGLRRDAAADHGEPRRGSGPADGRAGAQHHGGVSPRGAEALQGHARLATTLPRSAPPRTRSPLRDARGAAVDMPRGTLQC